MSQGRGGNVSLDDVRSSADLVFSILDTDNSNTLEESELLEWLQVGLKMRPAERRTFASKGKPEQTLVRFLASIEDNIPAFLAEGDSGNQTTVDGLQDVVQELFLNYDADGSGAIDVKELATVLQDLTIESGRKSSSDLATDAAKQVMDILVPEGSDGNEQLLTESVFSEWIQEGISMEPAARRAFAKRGGNDQGNAPSIKL